MLVEHTFVTTLEAVPAVRRACEFLQGAGFHLESVSNDGVQAVRGRKNPNTRKIRELPQSVKLVYDRGRVNVAAAITPRGAKDKPVHAYLMTALVRALEDLLAGGQSLEQVAATWSAAEAACRRGWTAGDKFLVGCLVVLLVLAAIIVIIGIAAS